MPGTKKRPLEDDEFEDKAPEAKRKKTQNYDESDFSDSSNRSKPKPSAKRTRTNKNMDIDEVDEGTKAKKPVAVSAKTAKKSNAAAPAKASSSAEADDTNAEEGDSTPAVETDFTTPSKQKGEIKIVSWNVAGFGAILKKGFQQYLANEDPDIICLQETKIVASPVKFPGYHAFFFPCSKPGLHGTGLLSKIEPLNVTKVSDFDDEGRVIVAEYDNFHLVNTYVPNSGRELDRLDFRIKWDKKLRDMMKKLEKTKPVIWTGDLNVAHTEIDLKNPKTNKRTAGFTNEERESFSETISGGMVDSYRVFHPKETDCYSFWTYKFNSRSKNVGWRMDYFMVSDSFMSHVTNSYIRKYIMGSDHCPIVIHVKP